MNFLYKLLQKKKEEPYYGSSISEILPWNGMLRHGVVLTKDLVLQKTLSFRGRDYLVEHASDINYHLTRLNHLLLSLDDGWAFQVDLVRRENASHAMSYSPHLASQLITEERNRLYHEYPHFTTQCYLTFFQTLTPSATVKKEQYLLGGGRDSQYLDRLHEREFKLFVEKVRDIEASLKQILIEVRELEPEETLAFLHNTISPCWMDRIKVPADTFFLDGILPDADIIPDPLHMTDGIETIHIMPISIYDYPGETYPLLLESLNRLAITYRMTHRYIVYDRVESEKMLNQFKTKWYRKQSLNMNSPSANTELMDTVSVSKVGETDMALEELSEGDIGFGMHTGTILLMHSNREALEHYAREVRKIFAQKFLTARMETLGACEAFLGSIPGNLNAGVRRQIISTQNLVDLLPIHADWTGNTINKHLHSVCGVGEPQFICSTLGGNAFRFNLNVGDVGHTLVCGPTGAGKSILLALLASTWLKYPGGKVIIFDKDRSAEGITQSLGGDYYAVGSEGGVTLQPLSLLSDNKHLPFVKDFIHAVLTIEGLVPDYRQVDILDRAIHDLRQQTPRYHRLAQLAVHIQDEKMKSILRQYADRWQSIIDGESDAANLFQAKVTTVEMNDVMQRGTRILLPTLLYLFYLVDQQLDGSPTLLILDEAWLFLQHEVFAKKLQDWLKTLRKKHAYVVLATQDITDFSKSSIKDTILNAIATRIYLPNPRSRDSVVKEEYQRVGLNEDESSLLANLSQKRNYYFSNAYGNAVLDLDLGDITLALLSKKSPFCNVLEHIRSVTHNLLPPWAEKLFSSGEDHLSPPETEMNNRESQPMLQAEK